MNRTATVLVLGLLLMSPAGASAQATSSSIEGTLRDISGAALPGVAVVARHMETGLIREVVSGSNGRFVMPVLPLGRFEVRATLDGFKPAVRPDVLVVLGVPATVSLILEPGARTEEVTVVAEGSKVQTGTGELSFLVGEQEIKDLPLNGRNYTDLAFLQPGVVAFSHRDGGSVVAHGVGASINGLDPRSNVYMLDGTPLNDFTNGPAGSAAGTTLGTETVREFRVETNSYSAEYGRNFGGQILVATKSGGNDWQGSLFEYHRNEALDSPNYFDQGVKPDFLRNQFGATLGGPIKEDKTFFFVGYEGLRENLGRNISTVVPDLAARNGLLPNPANPMQLIEVGVAPAVRPYLDVFPLPNGPSLGGGLAELRFPFDQTIRQNFLQARLDHNLSNSDQMFVRYTRDTADQYLPTDFPQFPRTFLSTNQFATAEFRHATSGTRLHTLRLSLSSTRIGQTVEANLSSPLPPFVEGRPLVGGIDIGGIPGRFGPQTSGDLIIKQRVLGAEYSFVQARGNHLIKGGALVERYKNDLLNPTFSLGIYAFGSLEGFLRNTPIRFIGLTPEASLERLWSFTLFGAYFQDEFRVSDRLSVHGGLRYEMTTLPKDALGRDSTLVSLEDLAPTVGAPYGSSPKLNVSPRVSFAWDARGDGKLALRGGYGLYYNVNNQQNLIVTITNPPASPRAVIANPTFPQPPFARGVANSIRPVQWDLDNPRAHVFNLNVQKELWSNTVLTVGYAGSRGSHLLRSGDVNVPTPELRADGTVFYSATAARPNTAFGVIEQKTSDGESWYNAGIFDLRHNTKSLRLQASYTLARTIDTTQASTFFSDATNGTTSAFPEPFGLDTNKGPADFNATHNLVLTGTWNFRDDWQLSMIGRYRSGNPLTVFIASNRSRSRWSPSLGPGLGVDRPSLAPGRTAQSAVLGNPAQWFDPAAFVLQEPGTFGDSGRGAFSGPDLRTVDLALVRFIPLHALSNRGRLEVRLEAFNILNRANFGSPALLAFTGAASTEAPLSTFGRIRSTVTSSRQIQIGLRATF
ncbi:MAG: TonB-dependent receptor [Vicinamibacteria bacterium]|nr:TonB-dependent receptor [Vicinamibacteria bacterium]